MSRQVNLVLIVIPTYQERGNIESLIREIAGAMGRCRYELIVVDDNNPDGTADAAADLAGGFPVRVLRRVGGRGRGATVRFGLTQAAGDIVGVMDADLQHPPVTAVALIREIKQGHDIAAPAATSRAAAWKTGPGHAGSCPAAAACWPGG